MAEAQALVERLVASQNPDGGWPYHKGSSWVEPTALVALALQSQQLPSQFAALKRSIHWLLSQQKPSGGWAPNSAVDECTTLSSLATLALLPIASNNLDKALTWTADQVYRQDLSLSLLLAKALHLPPPHAPGSVPWYPGTAGWVMPTSLTALVLFRAARETNKPALASVAAQSCSYLLTRRCADHGWNHGGSKTRSENANSYPETTGLALLALRAGSLPLPPASRTLANTFATSPQSIEGLSWIQLALGSPDPETIPPARTTRDAALRLIALAAGQGKNIFLTA